MKIYTNELGHITNMAAMPIYGKNLKNLFPRTNRPMILKLITKHCSCENYQGYTNYNPGLTLTYFTQRSNLVTWAFVWEKVKIIFFLETTAALGRKVA